MKRKPYAKDRRMALWLRKQPDSRLKIDLISGCNFKGTRDGPERFYVIRPHPFAVPPGSVMSANHYAAVPRQQQRIGAAIAFFGVAKARQNRMALCSQERRLGISACTYQK
jgi:hypothetical protein